MPTINPETDDLRPANQIIRERIGKRVATSTLYRWREKGVKGIRLECVLIAGVWCTTPAAFASFVKGQTEAARKRRRAQKC
jgi:hypothetical protein